MTNSSASYNSVRTALLGSQSKISSLNVDFFLQGSYGNATNIVGDSDVDAVASLDSAFFKDVSALDATQKQLQAAAHSSAAYGWVEFRADVSQTLKSYYGNGRVSERDKCIKVDFGPGKIAVDVIPALLHKKYNYFYGIGAESSTEGIEFRTKAGIYVVNFPKQHIANGESKKCHNTYKRMVQALGSDV